MGRGAVTNMASASRPTFLGDCGVVLSAWRKQPLFAVMTLVLAVPSGAAYSKDIAPHIAALILVPLAILGIGWSGTMCVWYQRSMTGGPALSIREAIASSARYVPRYFVFGLVVVIAFVLILEPLRWGLRQTIGSSVETPQVQLFTRVAGLALLQSLLAFAKPALAFSTCWPWSAALISGGLVKRHWHAAALYIFGNAVLGAVVVLAVQGGGIRGAATVVGPLMVVIEGAAAVFYVRNVVPPLSAAEGALREQPLATGGAESAES